MKILLIAGATGNTGRPLVEQSLALGHTVRVIVRSRHRLPVAVLEHPNIAVIEASILDLSDQQLSDAAKGCDAVVSCLGHVISFKGIFGAPRKLCTDATRRLCAAIVSNHPTSPAKFILMSTVGVSNPELHEKRRWFERGVLTLLRWFLPPHNDNETAAVHLHTTVGKQSKHLEWCSLRPDSLVNAEVSPYDVTESPVTGLFTGRPTTRSNVARFMTQLIEDEALWNTWKFKMPVIMNAQARSPVG
jgi:nucleoside-diphosphate-sugar epimerase